MKVADIVYIIILILGGIACLIAALDIYNVKGFKIKNEIIEFVISFIAVLCGLLLFIMEIFMI